MNNPPFTLDKRALARLLSPILYKCESTLVRDIDRNPDQFPAWERVCGKKIFETQTVLDFYPSGVAAAIRRSLEKELGSKMSKPKPKPPLARSLAEDLMAASAGAA